MGRSPQPAGTATGSRLGAPRRGPADAGENPLGYGEAAGALQELADLDDLIDQLGQEHAGATLDDIDVETVERSSARTRGRRPGAAGTERELERQGWLTGPAAR